MHEKLAGVFAPIPTPFNADGSLALDKLADNIRIWETMELDGYVALGSNGEFPMLTADEKIAVLDTCRKAMTSDRLLIAGTGCESLAQSIDLTKRAADVGADTTLVITPHYYKNRAGDATQINYFNAVADASPMPIMIYNMPGYTGVIMSTAAVLEAAQHDNIIGMKESTTNVVKMAEIVIGNAPNFTLLTGSASGFLPCLSIGVAGTISAFANFAPERVQAVKRAFDSGDMATAMKLQHNLIEPNKAVTAKYGVAGVKAMMETRGLYGGPVRDPYPQLTAAEREDLMAIAKKYELI